MVYEKYRAKVAGCYTGKAVGGTLGAPIEGWDGPHHLEFYDPVPTTMVPNDDLDLQVVWAMTIAAQPKPVVNSQILAEAWLKNVGFPWDEYAVAIRNLKNGIRPPFSGQLLCGRHGRDDPFGNLGLPRAGRPGTRCEIRL